MADTTVQSNEGGKSAARGEQHAYPCDSRESRTFAGLTIREHFAAMAMQGLIQGGEYPKKYSPSQTAEDAVRYADALLAELNCTRADRLTTLILAAGPALAALETELTERKASGNDEEFSELEQLVTNLREALP
jgi:hypothetical protein